MVDGPRAGDLYEVVVDVLGLADDAQTGERLHLFAVHDGAGAADQPSEEPRCCAHGGSAPTVRASDGKRGAPGLLSWETS